MRIEFIAAEVRRWNIATRMPFKYGIATMTDVPHLFVTVIVAIDGKESRGISADHLPPKWFTKEPQAPLDREIREMEDALAMAIAAAQGLVADSPFAFWLELYQRLMTRPRYPALLQHFGISLIERALLDAVCRQSAAPLWRLVQSGALGIELARVSPEMAGTRAADLLPPAPLHAVTLRHTVGMADFLREADIPPEEQLHDGLPQSLEACIRSYGLREFKLKLCGDADADRDRLHAVASVITRCAPADFRFSLDGNEQFASAAQLAAFAAIIYADPQLATFFEHLLFIEQPLHRKVALATDSPNIREAWPRPVPIIIDESDAALEDFPRALELGYAGVSHKNCKGVFKGIRNRCLISLHQQRTPQRPMLMTGEDLANIGPIALPQDLAVQALLGNASVERNGHHYFRGLSMFPAAYSTAVLAAHPQLYRRGPDGHACLQVAAGRLNLQSVNALPFACPDWSALEFA